MFQELESLLLKFLARRCSVSGREIVSRCHLTKQRNLLEMDEIHLWSLWTAREGRMRVSRFLGPVVVICLLYCLSLLDESARPTRFSEPPLTEEETARADFSERIHVVQR